MNRNMTYMIKRIVSAIATTLVYISIDQAEDRYNHFQRERTRRDNLESYKRIHSNYEKQTQYKQKKYMRDNFSKGRK